MEAEADDHTKKPFKRLSKSVTPINYNIKLHPNFDTFTCIGQETIDVSLKRQVNRFTLHSVDIEIVSAKYTSTQNNEEVEAKIVYKPEKETATFIFSEMLPEGKGKVEIVFNCLLGDKLKGFYRTKYTNVTGEEKYSASTQFATTHARRAFPCFDEPALKATFEVTLVAEKGKTILSNMDVDFEEEVDGGSTLVVHFKKTPIMSTYLVAFAIGEYDYVQGSTRDGIRVRVYTPLGKSNQGNFALEIAVKTLPFYAEYFGIAYPLPKLDLIAVPDLEYGAMENWGLVTYRERFLLVDEGDSSAIEKENVALVVGHELAHMWFGNITTMEWWTHLWLNEGFASWIEYLCVDHCCPEYEIWTQFFASEGTRALQLDALGSSHPIEVPCGHPSEIEEIFDAISYAKGACVIHMLQDYIGTDSFRAGLKSYLTEYMYKNAETEDLWMHLENASKKPVTKFMSTWTKQMGYPVLKVSTEATSSSQTILKISQKKFIGDGSDDVDNSLWAVPISVVTSKNPTMCDFSMLLNEHDCVVFLDAHDESDWIKLNPGQKGFYRTLYSSEMLQLLIPGIRSMSAIDRVGIESDMFALSIAGYTSTVDYLKLLSGYIEETDFTVWSDIIDNLIQLSVVLSTEGTDVFDKYKKFVIQLCKPAAEKLGMDPQKDENHKNALLRSLLLTRLGVSGDAALVSECQQRFEAHIAGSQCIPADIRKPVYSTVAVHGTEETIDKLMTLYRNTSHVEEQMRIGTCLGMNTDPHVLKKVLRFALSADVKTGDTIFLMRGCTSSLIGRQITWQFTQDNWNELYERYRAGVMLSRLIATTTKYFVTSGDADSVRNFFKEHPAPGTERTVSQSLESIEQNRKWLERDGGKIRDWLTSQNF